MPADSLLRPARVSVLIVDDAAAVRNAERVLLERRGYSVVGEADCAASALNYVKCLAPDAVLLDINLPTATASISPPAFARSVPTSRCC